MFVSNSTFFVVSVMPKIDMTSIPQKIVHVHRGKPIDLNIPIKAKPQPVCSWFFAGVKLKDSLDRIKIDSNGKYTHLTIRDTTINDTGDYTLEVKNAVGVATEVIKVIILGKWGKGRVHQTVCSFTSVKARKQKISLEFSAMKRIIPKLLIVSVQTNLASHGVR